MSRAALLLALLLAACLPLDQRETKDACALAELTEGGIGGTGILARDGGIGGTGIVGTVTGFASVCVNGLEVHYDAATPVSLDGQPASAAQLAVGQVVALEVHYAGGGWQAESIRILRSPAWVFGPKVRRVWLEAQVERAANGELVALGRSIRLGEAMRAEGAAILPGTRIYLLVTLEADGALAAERMVVPRPARPETFHQPWREPLSPARGGSRIEPRNPRR